VVDLTETSPLAGALPLMIGEVMAEEIDPGVLTSVASFKGQGAALSKTLKAAHGMAAPGAGRATGKEGARAIWFGRDSVLLMGPAADPSLADHAALTDQSDAWAVLRLKGAGARDVLARLTPIDLRDAAFKRGHTARTDLRHMMASITRTGAETYLIMVFRGFAETLVHDVKIAMESVAARQAG